MFLGGTDLLDELSGMSLNEESKEVPEGLQNRLEREGPPQTSYAAEVGSSILIRDNDADVAAAIG